MSLLEVRNLGIHYGATAAVDDISFDVAAGESVGLVGESGSGKTQTALAIMGLLPAAARKQGEIRFEDFSTAGNATFVARGTLGADGDTTLRGLDWPLVSPAAMAASRVILSSAVVL